MSQDDTDPMPLDGDKPLTAAERLQLRKILREDERARWAWRKLRVWVPIIGGGLYTVWQGVDWALKHITFKP